MNIKKIKSDKAITITDLIIAMIILIMFIGIIGSLFYQVAKNTSLMRMNAIAVNYTVQIAETIDELSYDEVTEGSQEALKTLINISDPYSLAIKVEKYSDINTDKKDLIKIVTIKVNYTSLGEQKYYQVKKLKIKEI